MACSCLRIAPLLLALFAGAVAHAQDFARGQSLYNQVCAQCHNPGASPGPEPIKLGAWNAVVIAQALSGVPEMNDYESLYKPADLQDIAAYLGLRFGIAQPPQAPATADAIEYYHAAFDHFFITAKADEIVKLDDGTFVGWTRTGRQFKVFTTAGSGLSGVCRFFSTSFGAKSSHFYTASASECEAVKANPDWLFEAEVFYMRLPDAGGGCASGLAVYRVYNQGQGGAPNHRLTIEPTVRQEMLGKGWIAEGAGIGVTMCTAN